MNVVTSIGAGFLAQLFPSVSLPATSGGATVIPFRPATIPADQVQVTYSTYDRMDLVLDKFNVPHAKTIDRLAISEPLLAGARYLFLGCDRRAFPDKTPQRIAEWVKGGGCLMTSDKMSFQLLEGTFLNDCGDAIVRRHPVSGMRPTPVAISEALWEDSTTRTLLNKEDPSTWRIRNCTYPVTVADRDRVTVLARSSEFGRMFDGIGLDTLFLRFSYGAGQVIHLVSHWYDQHFEKDPPSERPPSSQTMIFDKIPGSKD